MSPPACLWTRSKTLELIRFYRENEPLWNTKHDDYRNKEAKDEIMSDIGKRMNVKPREIHRKLNNLRIQLCHQLNKLKNRRNSGSSDECDDIPPTSSWPYFSPLKFLLPSIMKRSKRSDFTIQSMEYDEEKAKSDKEEDQEISKKKQEEKKGRKRPIISLDISDEEESKHPCVLLKTRNEDERFGEWVVLELQSLRSEANKRKLKSEIRRAICRIADLDNEDIFISSTSSNSSLLRSAPSPTYVPICEITNIRSEDNV